MAEETPVWNLSATQWGEILAHAAASSDALEDGAYVRAENNPNTGALGLAFYATALNKPPAWRYSFGEPIPHSPRSGATIGRAWHEVETGFVHFEVTLYAAAQAVSADYESGVSDLDYVTYEQAAEQALRGTAADLAWLHHEFGRLVRVTNL